MEYGCGPDEQVIDHMGINATTVHTAPFYLQLTLRFMFTGSCRHLPRKSTYSSVSTIMCPKPMFVLFNLWDSLLETNLFGICYMHEVARASS